VGHPRQMEPRMTHNHARAMWPRVLCPILRCWNGRRRCLFLRPPAASVFLIVAYQVKHGPFWI